MNKVILPLFLVSILLIFGYVNAQSDLVGYWKFDEGFGTTTNDISGYGNVGNIIGATWTTGRFGNGLSFDGSDDYVSVPTSPSLNFQNGSSLTIALWYYSDNITERQDLIQKGWWWNQNGFDFEQSVNNDGFLSFRACIGNIDRTDHNIINLTDFNQKWIHVAVVINSTKVIFYINGFNVKTEDWPGGYCAVSNSNIGIGGTHYYFNGIIDEVRIWNHSLTVDEIKACYLEETKYHLSGKLIDKIDNPVQANITVYNQGTNVINNSGITDSSGNYEISVYPDTYDIQYKIPNFFIPNFWIKLTSKKVNYNMSDLGNRVTAYPSDNKLSFTVDVNRLQPIQPIQTFSPTKPKNVLMDGIELAKVSSLSDMRNNTWFYNNDEQKLYLLIYPVVRFVVAKDESGDFVDIQTAINALPPEGGIVYIKAGMYDLNGKSLVVRSNLTLLGDGIDQTVIRLWPTLETTQAFALDCITSTSDVDKFLIENLTVVQNVVPLNNHGGIVLRGGKNTNITIKNVKSTDASGAGITVPYYNNVIIENCIVERTWTGIIVSNGTNALIYGNMVINTTGDGIFPATYASNVTIKNNYLENIGDTAIDITGSASSGLGPEKNVVASNNTIINGSVRVSNAIDIQVIDNRIQHGEISVDAGQGTPINVKIIGNQIVSTADSFRGKAGIGFYGAANSSAENNIITMEPPSTNVNQSGIIAAIWGIGIIMNNTILNSTNYGIDFGGWVLGGGSNITIVKNKIQGFGDFGIYDNAKNQGPLSIKDNIIFSDETSARWGIFTEHTTNSWLIEYNALKVKELLGDQAINASKSILIDNYAYTP